MKIIATFQVGMAMCSGALLAGAVITLAQDAQREPELVEKARQGDPAAQLALAIQYRDGKGVKKDNAEALRRALLAADRGDAAAMDFVGWMFFRGTGVKRNADIAVGYFKAAADKSAQAAWNLGQCYFSRPAIVVDIARP